MTYALGTASQAKLVGVHADLAKVVRRAIQITKQDFTVTEGLRTKARQVYLVQTGKSKTMNSRHLTGHAVDLAPVVGGKISWDWDHFWPIVEAMEAAAKELGVDVEAGARWKSFPDGPHYQLTWASYPK
jgi:peptidoglycan L-alanyl-D-glutamate endopeptidase CwlK